MNTSTQPLLDPHIADAMQPVEVVRWAHEHFGDGLVVTCSFADAVLPHLVSQGAPGATVVLLDTQYLFAETIWFARGLTRDLDLNLQVMEPLVDMDDRWQRDVESCCHVRKVEPLERALAGRTGWVTGVRRVDAPTRANTPVVSHDLLRDIVKINPLATWTDDDMAAYIEQEGLPEHPLTSKGYPSIGCWPCTQPVAAGADPRSGRWAGLGKTECGLHR
jgi:phosphoadenosine phosphosulfate reductase